MKKITLIIFALFILFPLLAQKKIDLNYYLPKTNEKNQVIKHKYFTVLYSNEYRQAFSSYYHLSPEMVQCDLEREDKFNCDTLVKGVRIKPVCYTRSGYDRGHLVCQADMCFSSTSMSESFYMTNISPQLPGFNRGIWKKLEHECREWVIEKGDLIIFTGGVLKPYLKRFSADSIAVPQYFYKIIVYHNVKTNSYETIAFLIPHKDLNKYDLNSYVCSIDHVEEMTGLDFLSNLPDDIETSLERKHQVGVWIID